jgi:hypothetical protein
MTREGPAPLTDAQRTVLNRLPPQSQISRETLGRGLIVAMRTINVLVAKGYIEEGDPGSYQITPSGTEARRRERRQ